MIDPDYLTGHTVALLKAHLEVSITYSYPDATLSRQFWPGIQNFFYLLYFMLNQVVPFENLCSAETRLPAYMWFVSKRKHYFPLQKLVV